MTCPTGAPSTAGVVGDHGGHPERPALDGHRGADLPAAGLRQLTVDQHLPRPDPAGVAGEHPLQRPADQRRVGRADLDVGDDRAALLVHHTQLGAGGKLTGERGQADPDRYR